jgi:hypothetical protein
LEEGSAMKVLQLSTGHLGGAGLAARRLNDALCQAGIDSTFVTLDKPSFHPGPNELSIKRNLAKKLFGGFIAIVQRHLSDKTLFSPFSLNSISLKSLISVGDPSETVLHFHNFQNLVSEKSIRNFSKAGYRIVLTLHDQRYFTGGCHYSFDCMQFQDGCTHCPMISQVLKTVPRWKLRNSPIKEISSDKLAVIAPSNWLISIADRSQVLARFKKYRIENLLGPDWLGNLQNVKRSRSAEAIVGIASMDPASYIKGGDIVQNLITTSPSNPIKFIFLKDFPPSKQVTEFWSIIDCLLVLSRADNSPNVIHEAKSFGIPIIASDVGGIPEMLDNVDVCLSLEEIDINTLLSALDRFRNVDSQDLNLKNLSERMQLKQASSLNKYIQVYEDILSN